MPGGSGCALLYNSLEERQLEFSALAATFMITRFSLKKKPVFRYELRPSNEISTSILMKVYGMLNFLMGFVADLDFNSEKCRCLGDLRFDLCGFLMCCCPKSRHVQVEYL